MYLTGLAKKMQQLKKINSASSAQREEDTGICNYRYKITIALHYQINYKVLALHP